MEPNDLKLDQFSGYPPQAKRLVEAHLDALRRLPLGILPSLLTQIIDVDYRFPVEQATIEKELNVLSSLSAAERTEWFRAFSSLSLASNLQNLDWVNQPQRFVEQLSAYLWATHQMDRFRLAATEYGDRTRTVTPPAEPTAMRRVGVVVIGQGVVSYDLPLFRHLREHGTYFTRVRPDDGVALLLSEVANRAQAQPIPFGHWYVDGGETLEHDPSLSCVSFQGVQPVRDLLLKKIETEIGRPGMGPEELRTLLGRLTPKDLGMGEAKSEVLDRFQVKLLTEGSGTQIFSTTFVQWAAREVVRRSQPMTLLVRYAPRQRQKPMNELIANGSSSDLDFIGSLIDADMGAYYQWISQKRLPNSQNSSFLVWFEGHGVAMAIGPSLPVGTTSTSALNLKELFTLVTA